MSERCQNIYKTARRAAGITQEQAAERLGISVESLRAYENGYRLPPCGAVVMMTTCYNAQYLAYQHLQQSNDLAALLVPPLEQRSLIELAIRIYNRMNSFQAGDGLGRLMAIAEDGSISEGEKAEFDAILSDIKEIVRTGLELDVFFGSGD